MLVAIGSAAGLIIGLIYTAPIWIAMGRDVSGFGVLMWVNIFLGWTGIVWIGCLLWALFARGNASAPKRWEYIS